jgi:hypothetical protein
LLQWRNDRAGLEQDYEACLYLRSRWNDSRNFSKTAGEASLRIWRLTGADPGGSGASRTGGNDMA